MKVLVINNTGAGFADYLEIHEGTTVKRLFELLCILRAFVVIHLANPGGARRCVFQPVLGAMPQ